MNLVPHIAKGARYTLGARIENKFLDLLELSYAAYFTEKEKKAEKITECILITDTLKFLVSVAWEGKLISNQTMRGCGGKAGGDRQNARRLAKKLGQSRKEKPHPLSAERTYFRRRNTNLLSGFHSLSGFVQLSFSHKPSSFRSTLKTFGLPSRSVLCATPSAPLPA